MPVDAALLGSIEPHAALLTNPPAGQLLYKMMTIGNFIKSMKGRYLHFNRVDSYADFSDADTHDGEQLLKDRAGHAASIFMNSADYSLAKYYDGSRARTYACCFSLENSGYIWKNYANHDSNGKVCVVFDFERLRATLNRNLDPTLNAIVIEDITCVQIFHVNYGVIKYVDWAELKSDPAQPVLNPILYTYLKDIKYAEERELRVSLSALGIGHYKLADSKMLEFPRSLHVPFDFVAATVDGTIKEIQVSTDAVSEYINAQLQLDGTPE